MSPKTGKTALCCICAATALRSYQTCELCFLSCSISNLYQVSFTFCPFILLLALPVLLQIVVLLHGCPVKGGEEGGVPARGGVGEEGRRT